VKQDIIGTGQWQNLAKSISAERLDELDFDRLAEALQSATAEVNTLSQLKGELQMLKEEYRKRILGMLKGILASRQDEDSMMLAASLSGDIEDFSAEQLIRQYSRVAARFRSAFPASFRYLNPGTNLSGSKNWSEHKI
jgi:predicted DNA-binding protein (UPF0278 family)